MSDIRAHAAVLTDHDEVLRRQVHPSRKDEVEVIHFTAFQPTGDEDYLLSTASGSVDPEECYDRHRGKGLDSMGTFGIQVGDASALRLACLDDADINGTPKDHVSVDFKPLARKERQRAARTLRDRALQRGPLYEP